MSRPLNSANHSHKIETMKPTPATLHKPLIRFALCALLALGAQRAQAQIAVLDSAGAVSTATLGSISNNVTVSAGAGVLVVNTCQNATNGLVNALGPVTLNWVTGSGTVTQTLTMASSTSVSNSPTKFLGSSIYYLWNPNSGAGYVQGTINGGNRQYVSAYTLTGVDTNSNPITVSNTTTATAAPYSITTPTTAGVPVGGFAAICALISANNGGGGFTTSTSSGISNLLSAANAYATANQGYLSALGGNATFTGTFAALTGNQQMNIVVAVFKPNTPVLQSPTATAITNTSATLGAAIAYNGGSAIGSRGTVWDVNPNPTANALAEGGTAVGTFTQTRTGLPPATLIYYRGYAVNSAGNTGYSPAGTFYTLSTAPTVSASGMNFSGVDDNDITVNWTPGDGYHHLVIAKAGSAPSGTPANATQYAANAAYGSGAALAGGYVVYDGTGSSVAVSGLTGGTTYYFVVYEYNYDGSTNLTANYLTSSSLSGNQATTLTVPTINVVGNPLALAFGNLGYGQTSANQTFTVSGANLSANISISAPSGFQISTSSGSGFGSGVTLTQSGGTVASTTIYARFAPPAVAVYSGNVTLTSAGATTVNVAVTGTGIPYAPTVTASAATSITTNAATLSGNIVTNGGGTITDQGFVYGTSTGVYTTTNRGTVTYNTGGTYTWVCPVGVTSVQVECWGGGGAGGWASDGVFTNNTVNANAGGGAGGAYAKLNAYAVTPGTTYYINVGTNGVSVNSNLGTGPGGDSWFNSVNSPSSTILAAGGAGGQSSILQSAASAHGAGGAGGVGASVGDVVNAGGSGSTTTGALGGGGGGSGGTGSAGNSAAANSTIGAAAVPGGGNGGTGATGTNPGSSPTLPPGGGGGGARVANNSTSSLSGGSGAPGQVVLTYNGSASVPMTYNQLSGLSPNVQYFWAAFAINAGGTGLSAEQNFWTLANVPAAPTVIGATTNSLNVKIGAGDGNSASTLYAIQETNSALYVQTNGTLGASAVWQATNTWGTITVIGLSPGTTNAFQVKARNGASVETAFGPAFVRYTVPLAPTLGNNGPLNVGGTLNLTASTVTGATNYAWTGPNGFTTNTQNPTITNVTTNMAGIYACWVTGASGLNSATNTTTVTVNTTSSAPQASFTYGPAAGTAPLTVNFTNTTTGAYTTALWTFGDGNTSTDTNVAVSHIYTVAPATNSVSLAVTNGVGDGSSTNVVNAVVVSLPPGTNAFLASLSLTPAGALSPGFTTNGLAYTATNIYPNYAVTVNATSADTNATLQLSFNGGAYTSAVTNILSVAETLQQTPPTTNTVIVLVTAQNTAYTNLYQVNVLLQPSQTVFNLTNNVVGGTNLVLTWPLDHTGYRLLLQVSNLVKGVSRNTNDWNPVSGSASTNAWIVPIVKTNLNQYYRMIYP